MKLDELEIKWLSLGESKIKNNDGVDVLNDLLLGHSDGHIDPERMMKFLGVDCNIPLLDYINDMPPELFCRCDYLTKITIPSNIQNVGEWAFFRCDNLQEIVFEGNTLKSINGEAFFNCPTLEKVILPKNINDIHKNAFYMCSNLKHVKLPRKYKDDLKLIGIPETVQVEFW